MSQTTLHIAEQDNVMVALRAIAGGHRGRRRHRRQRRPGRPQDRDPADPGGADGAEVRLPDRRRHASDIAPGEHVHSHNLTSTLRDDFDPSKHAAHQRPLTTPVEKATFDGFRRADGRVGIRNEISDRQHGRLREQRRRADRRGGAQGDGERRQLGLGRRRARVPAPVRLLAAGRRPGPDAEDPRRAGPPPQRGRRADPRARLREQPDEADAREHRQDLARARRSTSTRRTSPTRSRRGSRASASWRRSRARRSASRFRPRS